MIRVALYLTGILLLTAGLQWLAKRHGTITVDWLGYSIETSVFSAIVILAGLLGALVLTWSALRQVWRTPAALGRYLNRRRQQRGLDALTGGIIAVGAGDRAAAVRYAAQARRALPHEPLTHLLRAQAAQISEDRATARRIFEAMLASPDTEQLGLRGLFLEAEQEGEREAARQFAARALAKNPKLGWPVEALFDLQSHAGDWEGALETLAIAERQRLLEKAPARRRRAVLLTAQAQAVEDSEPERALELALEAHRLARDLVPAAAIAGRILASRGKTPRAARVLLRTWRHAPHPDLATAYAYARPGDSPRDRLNRVRHLARLTPNHPEAQIAVATSAVEARSWDEAREALKPLLEGRLTPRVCTLMARIEGEQYGDAGRVREWLARAATAPRDPAWVADGVAFDRWSPVSPVSGEFDAMRWRVPEGGEGDRSAAEALAARLEAVVGAGARSDAHAAASAADTAAPKPAPAAPTLHHTEASDPPAKLLPATAAHPGPRQPDAPAPAAAAPPQTHRGPSQVEVLAPTDVPFKRDGTARARPAKPVETKIFVSPRAPDDPGTGEIDDLEGYPTSGAKA